MFLREAVIALLAGTLKEEALRLSDDKVKGTTQTLSVCRPAPARSGSIPIVYRKIKRPDFAGVFYSGAGEGNRTLVSSLGSWCSAIELHPQTVYK